MTRLAKVKRILSEFWRNRSRIDYLEDHYSRLSDPRTEDEIKLGELMAMREDLRRKHKKHKHLEKEIINLKTRIIRSEVIKP